MTEIDLIVRNSLTDFTERVFSTNWWGKEREAVSLFAFGHLITYCRPNTIFYDPAQICIEARVKRAQELGKKAEICKDLAVWPKPGETCWTDDAFPLAIMEWKANHSRVSSYDVDWLTAYSKNLPTFIGYAICLDLKKRNFRLSCTRVQHQNVQHGWLVI